MYRAELINISADNLGANGICGFVECFVAKYYCRICELTAAECKTAVEEDPAKIRNKQAYDSVIESLDADNVDYKITKGVKKYCFFNDLKFFHILQNNSVDIMHDMNEGVIPFFLRFFFKSIIDNKFATAKDIQAKCRDHNYGWIWKKYKPSTISLESSGKKSKRNLNQNAMQSYCLLLNVPFIFFDLRDKIGSIWSAMEHLLQILQIVYSTRIRKSDIDRLRILIKKHSSFLVEHGETLLPKHHMMTHYPNLIMKIGPLIHSWMMRFESKHKTFTDMVHLTYNYKNLPYTLAKRHQAGACLNMDRAFNTDSVVSKKTYDINRCSGFEKYRSELFILLGENADFRAVQSIHLGSLELRSGLMLIEEENLYEIIHLIPREETHLIFCQKYSIVEFASCLNSIKIEKTYDLFHTFKLSDIKSSKSYDKLFLNGKMFIIAETLNVFHDY